MGDSDTYLEKSVDIPVASTYVSSITREQNLRGSLEDGDSSFSMMSVSIDPEDDSALEDNPIWFDKIPSDSGRPVGGGGEESNKTGDLELLLRNVDMEGEEIKIHSGTKSGAVKGNKKKKAVDRYDLVQMSGKMAAGSSTENENDSLVRSIRAVNVQVDSIK